MAIPAKEALAMAKETTRCPTLSVIIPVYNEVATIDSILRRVLAAPYDKEVIVVDDGSTDGTGQKLQLWSGKRDVVLLRHEENRGKGAAIRSAIQMARGYFTIIQDADLEYYPEDYPRLIAPLLSGTADVVYGSRYLYRCRYNPPNVFKWMCDSLHLTSFLAEFSITLLDPGPVTAFFNSYHLSLRRC
jgi:glycosyltransferase involved in cell wall biosynthesis